MLLKKFIVPCLFLLLIFSNQGSRSVWSFDENAVSAALETRVSPANDADPRDEATIAVSPVNSQIIVGASKVLLGGADGTGVNRVSYYYSSNGGRNWNTGLIPLDTPQKVWGRSSRPALAVDTNGVFYLAVVMLDNSNFDTGIYVYSSTNGGATFGNPIPVVLDIGSGTQPKLADKCYIAIDTTATSPFKDSLYVVWQLTDQFPAGQNRASIQFSYRRPGSNVFSTSTTLSHFGDMRGPSVTTGPEGQVYAAWEGIGDPKVLLFNASTDGGGTFLPVEAAPSRDINIHNFIGSLSSPSPTIVVAGMPRINSFPVIDCDRSNGPNRGMIYVAWAEARNGFDADIYIKRLTPPNGYRPEVSVPIRVNTDGSGADQFFPWLRVDPTNGALLIAFYDRRDTGTVFMNSYLARSTDGGTTFDQGTKVSSISSDPRIQAGALGTTGSAIGLGDYIGLWATNDKAHLIWTDTRDLQQSIYYGLVEYSTSGGGGGGGGGGGNQTNDSCQTPQVISAAPFLVDIDTSSATSADTDPVTCTGNRNGQSVWYSFTPTVNAVYGLSTQGSSYDTVLSVWRGSCDALTPVACSDTVANSADNASNALLTFSATAATTYLIEVTGKGQGGQLKLRLGGPTITGVNYEIAPDDRFGLRISGAGFVDGNARVFILKEGEVEPLELPTTFFMGNRQADGTYAEIFGVIKKLKKHVKPGKQVIVWVESPAGAGNRSNRFLYIRQ